MQAQSTNLHGQTVFRWKVLVEERKPFIVWASTEFEAASKVNARGYHVQTVKPANELV